MIHDRGLFWRYANGCVDSTSYNPLILKKFLSLENSEKDNKHKNWQG